MMRKKKRKTEARIMYSTNGKSRWWKREWKPQCPEEVFLGGQCQGVSGHDDVHWSFAPDGSFRYDDNENDPRHDGCAGVIPPDHKDYRTPQEMQKYYHVSHYTDTEVTGPEIIAQLEKGKPPEKMASINRPCTPGEIERLQLSRRIKKNKKNGNI